MAEERGQGKLGDQARNAAGTPPKPGKTPPYEDLFKAATRQAKKSLGRKRGSIAALVVWLKSLVSPGIASEAHGDWLRVTAELDRRKAKQPDVSSDEFGTLTRVNAALDLARESRDLAEVWSFINEAELLLSRTAEETDAQRYLTRMLGLEPTLQAMLENIYEHEAAELKAKREGAAKVDEKLSMHAQHWHLVNQEISLSVRLWRVGVRVLLTTLLAAIVIAELLSEPRLVTEAGRQELFAAAVEQEGPANAAQPAPAGEATQAPTGEAPQAPAGAAQQAPAGAAQQAPADAAQQAPADAAQQAPAGAAQQAPADAAQQAAAGGAQQAVSARPWWPRYAMITVLGFFGAALSLVSKGRARRVRATTFRQERSQTWISLLLGASGSFVVYAAINMPGLITEEIRAYLTGGTAGFVLLGIAAGYSERLWRGALDALAAKFPTPGADGA